MSVAAAAAGSTTNGDLCSLSVKNTGCRLATSRCVACVPHAACKPLNTGSVGCIACKAGAVNGDVAGRMGIMPFENAPCVNGADGDGGGSGARASSVLDAVA